jgi:hypothetical protein
LRDLQKVAGSKLGHHLSKITAIGPANPMADDVHFEESSMGPIINYLDIVLGLLQG